MTTLTIGVDSWKQLGLTPDAAAYVQFTPTSALLDGARPRSAAPWFVPLDSAGAAVTELPAPLANYGITIAIGASGLETGFAPITVTMWPAGSVDLATLLRDYSVNPDTFEPLDPLPPSAADVLATAEAAVTDATAASTDAGDKAFNAGQSAAVALGHANDAAGSAAAAGAAAGAAVAPVAADLAALEVSLPNTYARLSSGSASPLELVNFSAFGDSYAKGGAGSEDVSKFWPRVALRNRTKTLSNFGVPGTRSYLILSAIETNWVANTRGLVGLGDIAINDVRNYADSVGKLTTVETFRAMLARLSAWSIQSVSSASLVFGTGWTAGSTTTGGTVDVAWNGDACQILAGFVTGAGTTLTVRNSGTGAVVKTVATGGYKDAFTGVIELSGYGSGDHTVRVTAAGAATIAGVVIPSPAPPVIVWFKPGPYLDGGGTESARLTEYLAACAPIAAARANVIAVEVDSAWDNTTMLWTDGLHLNDKGNAYVTDRIQAVLSSIAFQQGLNQINAVSAGTYTPPIPAYVSAGATAPGQVTGLSAAPVTGGATLAWTRPADNGASLTGYKAQYRATGDTVWIDATETIAGGAVSATLAVPAGAKDFRIAAINVIGTGAYSTVATATVPAPATVYASDTFARADGAMGSTPVGGYAWTVRDDGTWAIVSGAVSCTVLGSDNNTAVLINDGQADGTISLKLLTSTANRGIEFRNNGTQAYVFFTTATGYRLSKKTGTTTYVVIQEVAQAPVAGDVMSVVLNGSSIVAKVNGAALVTTTDASYTGTQHGITSISNAALASYDDFSHTSALV